MCIYCGTKNYRKIYENHYGPVPRDSDGRKHEVHHVDGNRTNNDPTNLVCVSIKEHYDIHYAQQDWGACLRIAEKMKLPPEELSELARKNANKLVSEGTHPFLGGSVQRRSNAKRVAEGTHNFLGSDTSSKVQQARVQNGTHHFLNGELSRNTQQRRINDGTHHFLDSEYHRRNAKKLLDAGKHPTQYNWTCPHCNKSGQGKSLYTRWHGDNCKGKI